MSAFQKLPLVSHFNLSALPDAQVREAFARVESGTRATYAGLQFGQWQKDEFVWNERRGKWSSFTPEPGEEDFWPEPTTGYDAAILRIVARDLTLASATVENYTLPSDFCPTTTTEPLLRVASGTALVASSGVNYGGADSGADYIPRAAVVWELYNATTGALTASDGASGILGTRADGSYLLWAHAGNEWSVVRVRIGSGAWTCGAVYPGPGAPLLRKTGTTEAVVNSGNLASYVVPFDPLARVVSASCVLEQPVRLGDGTFDLPVGTLVLGGVRASRGGPQTALWALHTDGTARLLALDYTFSDGRCECAKTNHFASDVGQAPDGRLFVLSECDLMLYDPDGDTLGERLSPFPFATEGHPGGNCLRFPGAAGEMIHWTEGFGNEAIAVNDGVAHYNRMVRRLYGRDVSGPSTLWHGPCCAENYLGRFWAIRCDDDTDALESEDGGTLYLDSLENGRWSGFSGLKRSTKAVFWQRLRAAFGHLFVFGYKPSDPDGTETPTCSISDGLTLQEAVLPYFVRRATPSSGGLFLAARAASDGIGVANRVVEIIDRSGGTGTPGPPDTPGGPTHICSFWNEGDKAFRMSRTAFEALGGDTEKLPAFFKWQAKPGANGGGVWKPVATLPTTGYWLVTSTTSTLLKFSANPSGTLPFSPLYWNRLCFDILGDGSVGGPFIEPTCTTAQCVIDSMPSGSKFRVLQRPVPDSANPVTAIQFTDLSDDDRLFDERSAIPTLWIRVDSDEDLDDLTTYTRLCGFSQLEVLAEAARERIDAVILVSPDSQPVREDEMPVLLRRS